MSGSPSPRDTRCHWLIGVAGTALVGIAALGCGAAAGRGVSAPSLAGAGKGSGWSLSSKAFRSNQRIPPKYTCDGANVSPDLSWSAPPVGTVQLALICDDPDAPRGTWTHWLLYALPADRRSLPEGVPASETLPKLGGAKQGRNSFGSIGYSGPCPPKGPAHHYHFRLYALNARLSLPSGARQAELEKAMRNHILAQAELVGLYSH